MAKHSLALGIQPHCHCWHGEVIALWAAFTQSGFHRLGPMSWDERLSGFSRYPRPRSSRASSVR